MDKQHIIAIIFDFDDTLASDSTTGLLTSCGIDTDAFWEDANQLHNDFWDPVPAYLHKMIQLTHQPSSHCIITRELMQEWGRNAPLYPGVDAIFNDLTTRLRSITNTIALEFYIISSGIEEILHNTPIAHHFTDIWACQFLFDDTNKITFPKRIVSFTDKTRYIFHVAKGLIGTEARKKPFAVNRKYPSKQLRIPYNQMIFVGDGYTDIPCFSLVRDGGGIPLAVCDTIDRNRWGRVWNFLEEKRVLHWATANYTKGSTLYASLMMSLETIANNILLQDKIAD